MNIQRHAANFRTLTRRAGIIKRENRSHTNFGIGSGDARHSANRIRQCVLESITHSAPLSSFQMTDETYYVMVMLRLVIG